MCHTKSKQKKNKIKWTSCKIMFIQDITPEYSSLQDKVAHTVPRLVTKIKKKKP